MSPAPPDLPTTFIRSTLTRPVRMGSASGGLPRSRCCGFRPPRPEEVSPCDRHPRHCNQDERFGGAPARRWRVLLGGST